MKRFSFILTLIVAFILPSIAGNVVIKGLAKTYTGKKVSVFTTIDFISFTEKELANAEVKADGQFSITFDLKQTIECYVRINNLQQTLVISPNTTYEIGFISLDSLQIASGNLSDNKMKMNSHKSVDIATEFLKPDPSGVNQSIAIFNARYSNFVMKEFKSLVKNRVGLQLDTFRSAMTQKFKDIKNDYLKSYISYRLGSIEQIAQLKSTQVLIKEYFDNKPIAYENSEYMYLFNQVFDQYLRLEGLKPQESIHAMVNSEVSLSGLLLYVKSNLLLRDDKLTELILIKGLSELFYERDYNKVNILFLLDQLADQTKFPENKLITNCVKTNISRLLPGSIAPGFALKNQVDSIVNISDFKGKLLYLLFWNSAIPESVQALISLPSLSQKYSEKVYFAAICTDDNRENLLKLTKDNNLTFDMLFIGSNYSLLDQYAVLGFPTAVLISKTGTIVYAPMATPEKMNDIEMMLFNASKE